MIKPEARLPSLCSNLIIFLSLDDPRFKMANAEPNPHQSGQSDSSAPSVDSPCANGSPVDNMQGAVANDNPPQQVQSSPTHLAPVVNDAPYVGMERVVEETTDG